MLCLLVNIGFQVLFHSPPGVLFTFPSRYFSTIGHRGVFSLGGWSLRLPTRFLVSGCTLDPTVSFVISLTGLSPSLVILPRMFYYNSWITSVVLNPGCISTSGLGSFAFARRYLQNRFFSFFSCGYLDVTVPHVSLSIHYLFMYDKLVFSYQLGFPIRIPTDQGLFATPRGFSQLITSFFGSRCQGILPMLFVA